MLKAEARVILSVALLVFLAVLVALLVSNRFDDETSTPSNPDEVRPLALAVLGDSDSHAYHDMVQIPASSNKRGGSFRASTYQWTEVLALLRPATIDLGPWGRWGTGITWARISEVVGLPARAPRKEDHRNNFALSGAECSDLLRGHWRQAYRLLALMDGDPGRWRGGVVVIRIGVNSFGMGDSLQRLAEDPDDASAQAVIRSCIADIRASVALIRASHPGTRFVLVGVLNNADWPKYFSRWQTGPEIANIGAGLDGFDKPLREWARSDPGMAFFDDREWFASRWGSRGPEGQLAYRTLLFGGHFNVEHGSGDHPSHSVLGDGHAGAVWNALWAQSLVELLNASFSAGIAPIRDSEIAGLLDPTGQLGIRKGN